MISRNLKRVFYGLVINALTLMKKIMVYGKPHKWKDLNKTQEFVIVDRPNVRKFK